MTATRPLGKKDVAFLVAVTGLLLCNLAAVGTTGRGRARKAACLANLGQMTKAWLTYAADNEDKIVNGEADYGVPGACTIPMTNRHSREKCGTCRECRPPSGAGSAIEILTPVSERHCE